MKTILLVGCGNLGRRYIESLNRFTTYHLLLLDPYTDFNSIQYDHTYETFHTLDEISPRPIDLAIVTTCSDVRANIIRQIQKQLDVKMFLLEKILFQNLQDYEDIQTLFQQNDIRAWVHTPRSSYSFYRDLKKVFQVSKMRVSGSNWGLACNSVHFLDLFGYLSGRYDLELMEDSKLNIIPSKRDQYYEFMGVIKSVDDTLHLECSPCDSFSLCIDLYDADGSEVKIQNMAGTLHITSEKPIPKEYRVPYASEIIHTFITDILEKKECSLPTFETSVRVHIPLIELFTHVFRRAGITSCPVT